MADPLEIVAILIGLLALALAVLALWQPVRHRRKDDARAVVAWTEETDRLAADLAQQWERNLAGFPADHDTLREWTASERKLRGEISVVLGRLPEKLRYKIQDQAHDLIEAASALHGTPYYESLLEHRYRGEPPFDPSKKSFDRKSFGAWLDRTANSVIADLEDFSRT